MTLVLEKDSSHSENQNKILAFIEMKKKKQQEAKKDIIEKTFGKVPFDNNKTALEIQKEMRDEWS